VHEKNHDFISADEAFREGFQNKVDNLDLLEKRYESFEQRMEARIERDLNNSEINAEVIKKHIQNELNKKAQIINNSMNNLSSSIGTKRTHFELLSNNEFLYNNHNAKINEIVNKHMQSNFNPNYKPVNINSASPFNKIKEASLDLIQDRSFNYAAKKQKVEFIKDILDDPSLPLNSYTFHGQIPIYVDVQNRAKIITKAGKLVEIHGIISNFLLLHDQKFKLLNSEFEAKHKDDMMKKPYSLLQIDRNIRDKAEKISLSSLNDNNMAINRNEACENKKNSNSPCVVEAEKPKPRKGKENQKELNKPDDALRNKNKENIFKEKDSAYKDKPNIDYIIHNLVKIPNNSENKFVELSEEKHCSKEFEKREASKNILSKYFVSIFLFQ